MAASRALSWLVVTGAIVFALVGLSFLALDKPNVVWADEKPYCPHCRKPVETYARRCSACREEFDWVVIPEEDAPRCDACFSADEAKEFRERVKRAGTEGAERLAKATVLTVEAARAWLATMDSGKCAYCGGTGKNLAGATANACPVCFGEATCPFCDGETWVRVGDEAAAKDVVRLRRRVRTPRPVDRSDDELRDLVKKENEEFVRRWAGAAETKWLWFWPSIEKGVERTFEDDRSPPATPTAYAVARTRLEGALRAFP